MPELPLPYAHAWESMAKGIDDQGPYYRVSYRFANWADADQIANALRGYTSRSGSITYRTPPHQHPLSSNLLCADVQIEGIGSPVLNANGLPYYDNGFFAHCIYRSMPWMPYATNDPGYQNQIDPTTPVLWATQELDFEEETYPFDEANQYTWASGPNSGQPTGVPMKATVGIVTMVITYHQLPYLPMTVVRNLYDKLNNATFMGVAAEKLWFKGARTVRDYSTDGTVTQKVQLVFKERTVSWRKILDKSGQWQYVLDGGGNYLLQTADLSPLVQL